MLRCFFFFLFFSGGGGGGGERLSLEMGDSPPPTSADAEPDRARLEDEEEEDFFEDFFDDFEYFSTSLSEDSDDVYLEDTGVNFIIFRRVQFYKPVS